jgi:hypothetical protein
MQPGEALDAIGSLIAAVKSFGVKLPAIAPVSVMPSGYKPAPEAVEAYENVVSRFRNQAGGSAYRRLTDLLTQSLEAFEAGRLLEAIQPLLLALEQLELLHREKTIAISPAEQQRVGDYRAMLFKVMPGSKPELDRPRIDL